MARTIEEFVGKYTIRHGQGNFDIVEDGFLLCIGTGGFGDPKSDGVKVGISIVNPQNRQRVLPVEGNPPTFAYLVEGTLNGSSYWLEDSELPQLLAYQISLMTSILPNGGLYRAPSIMISIGDPENAGVWGADDQNDG